MDFPAGSYKVTISDSNGCQEIREVEIENAELFDVNPTITPVSCFGANDGSIEMNFSGVAPVSFIWSSDSSAGQNRYNLSPGIYSVLITDASGCEIQRDFTIIEPQEISLTGVLTDASETVIIQLVEVLIFKFLEEMRLTLLFGLTVRQVKIFLD